MTEIIFFSKKLSKGSVCCSHSQSPESDLGFTFIELSCCLKPRTIYFSKLYHFNFKDKYRALIWRNKLNVRNRTFSGDQWGATNCMRGSMPSKNKKVFRSCVEINILHDMVVKWFKVVWTVSVSHLVSPYFVPGQPAEAFHYLSVMTDITFYVC